MPGAALARSHLAPFLEGPGPYLVVARNAIPVAGVWVLGWSEQLADPRAVAARRRALA